MREKDEFYMQNFCESKEHNSIYIEMTNKKNLLKPESFVLGETKHKS